MSRPILFRDYDTDSGMFLAKGRTLMSHVNLADPGTLTFPYMQRMAEAIMASRMRNKPGLRTMHLGGGAMSMPRWLAVKFDKATSLVVEIDPEVAKLACGTLPLPEGTALMVADAVDHLKTYEKESLFDIIIVDCMGEDYVTPPDLISEDAFAKYKSLLKVTGLLLINLVTDEYGNYEHITKARTIAHDVFPFVVEILDPQPHGVRRNVVLAGWLSGDTMNTDSLMRHIRYHKWVTV